MRFRFVCESVRPLHSDANMKVVAGEVVCLRAIDHNGALNMVFPLEEMGQFVEGQAYQVAIGK